MNQRLTEIRNTLGLSMEKFGSRIGISRSGISKMESGKSGLSEQTIISICREFEVREEWLRTGKGEMFEELTDAQKKMKYTALLLKDLDSKVAEVIMNLIITYEQLDETSREVLEKVAVKYIENMKKSKL